MSASASAVRRPAGTAGAGAISPARWALLSPWLDKLLDADGAERGDLLAQAASQDPTLPGELANLLQRLDAQADDAFMQAPARRAAAAADAADAAGATAAAPGSAAGQRIGAYVVQRLLGQGGMGSVWLAQRADGRYDGQVAIKFLHGGLSGRGDARRFAREGQILARLDHPHIARLLDAGTTADDNGRPYLVLELVQGLPIDEHVRQQALEARATVALFMDVLAAVSHAHERLILHRDLKPSNILVTGQGQVKLLDFGIAKLVSDALDTTPVTQLTQQAGRAFTLRYAAPEQVNHGEATTATDVYALGVLLHELLTGGLHPTAGGDSTTPLAQLQALVHTTPRRPSEAVARHGGTRARKLTRVLQGDLDTVISRALKKQPAERYRNAADLADDLRRYLHHEPIAARPDSAAYRLARFVRRNRWGMAAGTAVVLALGTGTGLALRSAQEARAQRVQAESLVEFMLGELRAKLDRVGRLDVLDGVGSKVLAYYEQQDPARLDADALGRRGQALTLVGQLAEKRGQLPEAERSLLQAVASLAELARREPDNVQRLLDYGESVSALGLVQWHRGDVVGAEAAKRQRLALNVQAHALRPDKVDLGEVVSAQINLAIFQLGVGRAADALPLLQEAHASALHLAQTQPSSWTAVANIRLNIAEAQYLLGRSAASIATTQTQLAAVAKIPGGDKDVTAQRLRALGLSRLASSELMTGQLNSAASNFSDAVRMAAAVSDRDPDNFEFLAHVVRLRLLLTESLAWAGRTVEAQGQLDQAQTGLQTLLKRADPPLDWRLGMRGNVLLQRALLAPSDPRLVTDLQSFLAEFSGPGADNVKFTSAQVRQLARVGIQLGDTLTARRQPAAAQAAWHTALAALEQSAQGTFIPAMATMARLHARLGSTAKARALMVDIEKSEYRHPEYVAFRRAMQSAAGAGHT